MLKFSTVVYSSKMKRVFLKKVGKELEKIQRTDRNSIKHCDYLGWISGVLNWLEKTRWQFLFGFLR